MLTVQRKQDINSWQVPLVLKARQSFDSQKMLEFYYWNISHTLCPERPNNHSPTIFFLSTMTNKTISFEFSISIQDLSIHNAKNAVATPSAPLYFLHTFPPNVSSLLVKAESQHPACTTLSIQQATCPVYDMVGIREHSIYHALITTKGAATVVSNVAPSFFIVLSVKPNDYDCVGHKPVHMASRDKNFSSVTVTEPISYTQFLLAIFVVVIFFIAIYVVAILSHFFFSSRLFPTLMAMLLESELATSSSAANIRLEEEEEDPSKPIIVTNCVNYGATREASSSGRKKEKREKKEEREKKEKRKEEEEKRKRREKRKEEREKEEEEEKRERDQVAWYQSSIRVVDLFKPSTAPQKVYRHYFWNILTVAIFYFLPVIQLVLYFQLMVFKTGDGDLCYFNFYCMHPFHAFLSFNSVFSNIGYILLGGLFLIIIYFRERQYMKFSSRIQDKGLPQRFDLWYAMGVSLVMEGFLSACYHVCPSYKNFQFDTSFMYMIGWVSALRIFFMRHNPSSLRPHTAYLIIAFVVLVGVIGVVRGNLAFWTTFTFVYIVSFLVLSFNFYCVDDAIFGGNVVMKVYNKLRYDRVFTTRPKHLSRFIFLVILNLFNWGLAIFGWMFSTANFASYLLTIVISNFLLYFLTYLVMKVLHRERFFFYTLLFLLLSLLLWSLSFYFFFKKLSALELSPALSRTNNEACAWMGFYDFHDIWHFLSSLSLFFSFLVILTMDDGLFEVPRHKIKVF